jgi:hypothetical protein
MQLMKQQITLQNHQFLSVQSMIPPLLHTATALFFCQFLMCFDENDIVIKNTDCLFVQILQSIFRFDGISMAIPGRGDW